jgi:hypothetical protein
VTARLLAVALAISAGAAAGCKSKKKEGVAAEVAAIEGMDAVPASVDVVLGADVRALMRSELVERAAQRMLLADPGLSKELQGLFAGCKLSPSRDLRVVVLAMDTDGPRSAGRERALLVASGTLSEGSIAACVAQHLTALGGQLVETQVDGRTHYHADAPPDRLDVWFAFGARDTVVVSSSPELLAEALGTGPRLAGDERMAGLIARARQPRAALWAAGRVAPDVGAGLKAASNGAIGAPQAMFGHVVLEDGLTAELGAELASPEEATSAVAAARTQLGVLAQVAQKWKLGRLVAKVAPEAAENRVFLRLALTPDELRAAVAPIDTGAGGVETATPPVEQQGASRNGEGDAAPGDEAPVPEQGQVDR